MKWNRERFHFIGNARTGDACCSRHISVRPIPAEWNMLLSASPGRNKALIRQVAGASRRMP
jgi:hypothetical protein